jgi:hypothetical protein
LPNRRRSWLWIATVVIILVSSVAGFLVGYKFGISKNGDAPSATQARLGLSINSSDPITANPFTSDISVKGNTDTAYFPVVYLPETYSSSVYVQYDCFGICGNTTFSSIAPFNITSYTPQVYLVLSNGTDVKASKVAFNSTAVIQQSSEFETVVYTLTNEGNNSGYYSFVFPYTCELLPLLYIGSNARDVNYDLVRNWLATYPGFSQPCSKVELDVTILGFTNTYYNHLTVSFQTN